MTTTSTTTAPSLLDDMLSYATTGDLIRALLTIDTTSTLEMHERLVQATILDTIATRLPAYAAALATDDLDDERTSTEILIDLLAA